MFHNLIVCLTHVHFETFSPSRADFPFENKPLSILFLLYLKVITKI